MDKSSRQLVQPSGKGRETSLVFLAAAVVLITCVTLIFMNRTESESIKLQAYQISAFEDLNEQELAIFNGLFTSAIEIYEIHKDEGGKWLTVGELEKSLLPPFVKDLAWENNGRYEWIRRLNPAGSIDAAVYTGYSANKSRTGSFILLFLHDHAEQVNSSKYKLRHAPYEIWYHASSREKTPEIIMDQAFIAAGWKEVEPLSGKDEVKRIKG